MATARAAGEQRLRSAADVDEPEPPPEAAAGSVDAGWEPDDDPEPELEPEPVVGLADSVEEGSDAEPVPGTMVRGVEQLPSRVVRSAALAMAAGVEPQLAYCCMWMALVSRSKTTRISESVSAP
jgi:hypothetical protein